MGHHGLKWVNKGFTLGALMTHTPPPASSATSFAASSKRPNWAKKGSNGAFFKSTARSEKERHMLDEHALLLEVEYFMTRSTVGHVGRDDIIKEWLNRMIIMRAEWDQ